MVNGIKRLVFYFLMLVFTGNALAQITANPSGGCAPLSVQFSGPAGATNITWNLGPAGTTTLSNPNPIYTSTGTFVISFSGTVNGSTVSYTTLVTVGSPPSANFSYTIPSSHCAPLTASFSASGAPPGSTYSWAFGDLTSVATGSLLTHVYSVAGLFSPVCIVADAATGCTAVVTAPAQNSIAVSALPNLQINSSNGFVGCAPPFLSSFTSSNSTTGSPLGGGLTYNWQINVGSPASGGGANIGPVTFGQGNHTVTLLASDNNSCTHSITAQVGVILAAISATIPPYVCFGENFAATVTASQSMVTYTSTAFSGSFFRNWQPGATDTIIMPVFTIPGPQSITFFSSGNALCPPVSVTKTFTVELVTASVTAVPPFTTCAHSLVATFINNSFVNTASPLTFSSGASGWTAAYYNVTQNPIFTNTVTQNITFTLSVGSQNPYTILWSFNPLINFVATSTLGCKSNFPTTIFEITPLTARFTRNTRKGCAPLVVNFRDTSYTSLANPVTSYTWNSGTVPPVIVTNTSSTTFTYSSPGIYIATYTVQAQSGCIDFFRDTVYVTTAPTVSAAVPASVCAGVPITLTLTGNAASPPGAIDHWHIAADKNYFSGCITDNTPTFPFTHLGTNTVEVSAYQWNCGSAVTLTNTIEVKGPLGKFVFSNFCGADKMRVDFEVHLLDVTTATLNYGDGSPPQIIAGNLGADFFATYSHTYATTGDYNVSLQSSNAVSGCGNRSYSRTVKIRDPKAIIKWAGQPMPVYPVALSCTKARLRFDGLSSTGNSVECTGGYTWWLNTPNGMEPPVNNSDGLFQTHDTVLNKIIASTGIRDTFRVAGNYTISLQVKDINGCADRVDVPFRVSSAVPVFTFNSNPVCYSAGSVQVINTTQSAQVSPDAITGYTFSFGNGAVVTSTNPLFNPINVYAAVPPPSQTFQVMAIAKNQTNCIDTTIHILQVNNPVTGFMTSNFYPCIPQGQISNAVPFTAMSGYNTYSFSNGSPSNNPTWQSSSTFSGVTKYYSVPAVYFPTLTVIDAAGCKATDVLTITALGQPTAVIKNLGVSGYCVPAKIRLVDTSRVFQSPITNYQWSYGNFTSPGSVSDTVLENILPTPGSYTMSLIVTVGGNGSCPSIAKKVINVFDTKAEFEIDKTKFCLGDNITVKAKGLKDVYSWKWFFGDLVSQPVIYNTPFAANPITYQYNTYPSGSVDGKTVIFLKAVSDNLEGCVVTKTVAVQVIRIEPDFKHVKDFYIHCLSKTADVFTATTANPLNLVFTNNWNFGGNATSKGDSSKFIFPQAGVFPIILTVQDTAYGCKASAIKNMTILPLPSASIRVSDTLVCPKDTFSINIKGASQFAGGLRATLQPKLLDNYRLPISNTYSLALTTTVSTYYKLMVSDTNNCSSPFDSALVKVPAVPTQVNTSTTIVIGQTVTLNAPEDGRYSYYWRPEIRHLSDSTIAAPVCSSLSDIMYTVTLVDEPRRCWSVPSTFTVIVLPITSIDMPTAFTPNGDGINDLIFPDGWGIKKLVYFRIYNRWGQLIFETNLHKQGWDGTFLGDPQNMDTYVYQVEAETYISDPKIITKSGTFKLIR